MVLELLCWVSITLICYAWGIGLLKLIFGQQIENSTLTLPVICFFGLGVVSLVAWYLSLFSPIQNWFKITIAILGFAYYASTLNRKFFFSRCKALIAGLTSLDYVLSIACLVMVIFLASSPVIHPDTLNYHIYSVLFFDHFGMVPGLVHLKPQFGFQSLWFVALNVFEFRFLTDASAFYLNGAVLCWFILFLVSEGKIFGRKWQGHISILPGMACFGLLFFTLISWTQIRLTASSASPDFISALCVFSGFYFLIAASRDRENTVFPFLAIFFSLMAVCTKLSVIVILLIPILITVNSLLKSHYKRAFEYILVSILVLAPLITRNVVTSGYPLYPSSLVGPLPVDWKMDRENLNRLQHYITGYARYPIDTKDADSNNKMSLATWVPNWWEHLYLSDKALLLVILMGLVAMVIFFGKWKNSVSKTWGLAFLIAFTGSIIWFIYAPDPRFGSGFLLSLVYFIFAFLFRNSNDVSQVRYIKILAGFKWIAVLVILLYVGYRGWRYTSPREFVYPAGVAQNQIPGGGCDGRLKEMMLQNGQGLFPLEDSCRTFIFRGKELKNGFRTLH